MEGSMHKSTGYLILSAMSPTYYTLLLMVHTIFVQPLRLTCGADRWTKATLNKNKSNGYDEKTG